jgi:Ca2+-binding RTX toxin-like protein
MLAAVMIAAAVPVAASDEAARATGTLHVTVIGAGKPVKGAEVFLNGTGTPLYACTNASGIAKFYNVPTGVNLSAATGPAVAKMCNNPDFLNADGNKMLWMAYQQVSEGNGAWTQFQVTASRITNITIRPKTPRIQDNVCYGHSVTRKGKTGPDLILGTPGDDVINGLGGDDIIWGGGGNDTICGGPGNDILIGDDGNDWLSGGDGYDTLLGAAGDDRMVGNRGNDRMVGGSGADWFWGLAGPADYAQYKPGPDKIHTLTTEIKSWTYFIAM